MCTKSLRTQFIIAPGRVRCQGSVEFCFAVENVPYSRKLAVSTEIVNIAIHAQLVGSSTYSNEVEESFAIPVTPVTAREFD